MRRRLAGDWRNSCGQQLLVQGDEASTASAIASSADLLASSAVTVAAYLVLLRNVGLNSGVQMGAQGTNGIDVVFVLGNVGST